MLELTTIGNEVVMAKGGNIRETTVLGIEVLGGREGNSGLQVGSNNISLVAGGGHVVGKTSSSGDQSSGP